MQCNRRQRFRLSDINVVRLLSMREGGSRNDKTSDFLLSRLRCYDHPVDNYREQCFSKRVNHSNIYAHWAYSCKFAECPGAENTLARTRADGWITVLNPIGYNDRHSSAHADGRERLQRILVEHNAIVDFAWSPNDLKLISGSADGKLSFCYINSPDNIPGKNFFRHKCAVRSVCFSKHRTSVFVSGGQIGEIFLHDCRSMSRPIFSIANAHEEVDNKLYGFDQDLYYQEGKSVTGIVFQNENTLFSCSFGKRIIKAWDLRYLRVRYVDQPECKYSLILPSGSSDIFHGFTSLSIDPWGEKLYARCSNGSVYAYDVASSDFPRRYFPVAEYKSGNGAVVNYADSITTRANLSPDGNHLICSSNSDTAYIWNTNNPGMPVAKLTCPGDVIKSVDWSRASQTRIATYTKSDYVGLWEDEVEVNKKIRSFREQ